ncbi:hypothetical protein [Streptomyces sp. NPDC007205]|uniref:hypothetical protein n=1 Tax=Streptomyces sp. NPDC007205 TaxID=3154316 RepID=UPI0033E893A0
MGSQEFIDSVYGGEGDGFRKRDRWMVILFLGDLEQRAGGTAVCLAVRRTASCTSRRCPTGSRSSTRI